MILGVPEQVGPVLAVRQTDIEAPQQPGRQRAHLQIREVLADAAVGADREGGERILVDDQFVGAAAEAFGDEGLGIPEVAGV